jgi:hypothetical protein
MVPATTVRVRPKPSDEPTEFAKVDAMLVFSELQVIQINKALKMLIILPPEVGAGMGLELELPLMLTL